MQQSEDAKDALGATDEFGRGERILQEKTVRMQEEAAAGKEKS